MPLLGWLISLRNYIVKINPHIKDDLINEAGNEWVNKTSEEKDRSVMAFFAQTWERIIYKNIVLPTWQELTIYRWVISYLRKMDLCHQPKLYKIRILILLIYLIDF